MYGVSKHKPQVKIKKMSTKEVSASGWGLGGGIYVQYYTVHLFYAGSFIKNENFIGLECTLEAQTGGKSLPMPEHFENVQNI